MYCQGGPRKAGIRISLEECHDRFECELNVLSFLGVCKRYLSADFMKRQWRVVSDFVAHTRFMVTYERSTPMQCEKYF